MPTTGTNGQWRRLSQTFTPGPADATFKPRVIAESSPEGFLIDDLCLVEGPQAESGTTLIS